MHSQLTRHTVCTTTDPAITARADRAAIVCVSVCRLVPTLAAARCHIAILQIEFIFVTEA